MVLGVIFLERSKAFAPGVHPNYVRNKSEGRSPKGYGDSCTEAS